MQLLIPGTLLSVDQVAIYFGVESRTVKRWQAERGFPAPKTYGGVRRWKAEEILGWMIHEEVLGKKTVDNAGQCRTTDAPDEKGSRRKSDQV
jgi:excisionase family DNA binding protein